MNHRKIANFVKTKDIDMNQLIKIDTDYAAWIAELGRRYRQSQIKAAFSVNTEMLKFYWSVGRDIARMNIQERWGQGVMKQLSIDLTHALDSKGFSETSIGYMRRFYLLYPESDTISPQVEGEIYPQVGGEIIFRVPWSHHKEIIDKVKGDTAKGLFFAKKTLENAWGRGTLLNFLSTDLYERQGIAETNFALTMPAPDSDLAQQMIKSPYNFDFLHLNEKYSEKELKDELMGHVIDFLLELGKGFSLYGREFRLSAGGVDKYIDLLFYIVPLHRFCVIEVKITRFDFQDAGQLAGYVALVDDLLKGPGDGDTIGLLICKEKNNVLARYALSKLLAPIGVSEYELGHQQLPDSMKGALPSPEEIEQGLKD